jgi:hypothetical protein
MTPYRICYRRPETPWSLSRMTAPTCDDAMLQVLRLQALGYAVTEVMPPLPVEFAVQI